VRFSSRFLKLLFVITLLLYISALYGIFAQSDGEPSTEQVTDTSVSEGESPESSEKASEDPEAVNSTIQSTSESRRETLLFGIHSEVVEVLHALKNEKNDGLNQAVAGLFTDTDHSEVHVSILELFAETNDPGLVQEFVSSIEEPIPDDDYIIAGLRYLNGIVEKGDEVSGLLDLYRRLTDHGNELVAGYAVRGIGRIGDENEVAWLLEMLHSDDTSETLKDDIVLALGDAKVESAVGDLADIVADSTADRSLRWYACDALGKIGTEESLRVIEAVLTDEDTMLRAYAVSALGSFSGNEAILDLLTRSLRDSFWRVRVGALKAIGEISSTVDVTSALNILTYKAKRDPEQNVRAQSIHTLGRIDVPAANQVLLEIYKNQRESPPLRINALEAMINGNVETVLPDVLKTIRDEWDRNLSSGYYQPTSKFVEHSSKVLSRVENPLMENFFLKCLGHPKSVAIQIYGLRGIAANHFTAALEVVEEMTGEKYSASVQREAKETLNALTDN
jgi:HEAT repeat protein